eukprot:COSAG06_NODE_57297_length_281_cov_0.302198_1_plen_92_part_10
MLPPKFLQLWNETLHDQTISPPAEVARQGHRVLTAVAPRARVSAEAISPTVPILLPAKQHAPAPPTAYVRTGTSLCTAPAPKTQHTELISQ